MSEMNTSTKHHRRATRIDFESLESRRLLAAFGTPWPDARSLTVSFPDDGTAVGQYSNDIRQSLSEVSADDEWQELALRAFQTWAVHADINVGLRSDHGLDFGAPGLSHADPRFGDFRIGAFPQVGVLANAIPFQALAGTNSGDVLLNSAESFTYHDWSDGLGPDPDSLMEGEYDIFSVLLHETGNALGLDDTSLDWTVMFRQYTVPKGALSTDDIAEIQSLYGARTDPFEMVSNDQMALATLVAPPVGFNPQQDVLKVGGSLRQSDDVDYYELTPSGGQNEVTIRLQASGISLVKTEFQVLNAAGMVLADSSVDSVFDNDHQIHLTGLQNESALFLRVAATDTDVFSVGDYEIAIDYRSADVQAADPQPGAHDAGAESLHNNFALADDEAGANDVLDAAESLLTALGSDPATRYEVHSAVSSGDDVDYWKITAPEEAADRLVVNLNGVGLDQPGLRVRVVDHEGAPVGASGHLRDDGTWALEVAQPQVSQDYFIRVSVDPDSEVDVGNYVIAAEFVTGNAQMNDLASGDVTSDVDDFIRWTAGKSRLYRFDLGAAGESNQIGVQLTVYDAHTHEVRLVLSTPSSRTRTAFAWLAEGDYILRFSAIAQSEVSVTNVQYEVAVDGISDDQNPEPEDDEDTYEEYYYYYYETPPDGDPPPDTGSDPWYGYYYYEYSSP